MVDCTREAGRGVLLRATMTIHAAGFERIVIIRMYERAMLDYDT
jgi:hypothetical protein